MRAIHIEATVINEKNRLETVNELAADKPRVAGQVLALRKSIEQVGAVQLAAIDAHMNGKQSLLDIKKMLEAQAPAKADLQLIIDYTDVLAKAGLVEIPPPSAT